MSETPCYAVIFTSSRRSDHDGYDEMATRMDELARRQPGFIGVESARGPDGIGITVSYWESIEAIAAWGRNGEHLLAQKMGRERFYEWYEVRICSVTSVRSFGLRREKGEGPSTAADGPS